MLEINGLHVRYGTTHAVRGLDLEVRSQDALALVGPNGAGKTSILRAISGLTACQGSLRFDGMDLSRAAPDQIARAGLIHVPEGRRVFGDLSVHENLLVGAIARQRRATSFSVDDVYSLFPALVPLRHRLAFALSGGEQQMLALGRALVASPRLLLVDEPSLGLAPKVADVVAAALVEVRSRTALVVVEQNVAIALRICTRAAVVSEGSMVVSGSSDELQDQEMLIASYLGQRVTSHGRAPGPREDGRP